MESVAEYPKSFIGCPSPAFNFYSYALSVVLDDEINFVFPLTPIVQMIVIFVCLI